MTDLVGELAEATFRMWHFTASHDRLVFEVTTLAGQRKYVNFIFCTYVSTPVRWKATKLSIEKGLEQVVFKALSVEIHCEEIQLFDTP